jgi:predicted enzyme related to lactoylglutathione lyase
MVDSSIRLVTVIFEVADLNRSVYLYREGFGIDLHEGTDNDLPADRWLAGKHAAYSWHEGAHLHFALYQAKTTRSSTGAQVGFQVEDLDRAHTRAVQAGATVLHDVRAEPWGPTARYLDYDGNVISLTQGHAN